VKSVVTAGGGAISASKGTFQGFLSCRSFFNQYHNIQGATRTIVRAGMEDSYTNFRPLEGGGREVKDSHPPPP
jgi:hypothetical protein